MVNIRRAQSFRDRRQVAVEESYYGVEDADPMDEIARLLDDDLRGVAQDARSREEMEDALAAEYKARLGSLDPVDLSGDGASRGRQPARQAAYADPWDDEAIDRFADELAELDEDDFDRFPAGVLPSHGEAPRAAQSEPRRRGPVLAAVSLAVLALAAVGGWWVFGSGSVGFGEPALVQAPTGPYKIVPDKGDTIDEPAEGSVVFNGTPEKGDERLVTRDETVPELPGVQPQVPRVILPNGQEVASGEPVDLGPRRVRTTIVRPDGTIVQPNDAAAPASSGLLPPAVEADPTATAALPGVVDETPDPIGQLVEPPAETATARSVEPVTLPETTADPAEIPVAGLRLPPAPAASQDAAPSEAAPAAPAPAAAAPAEPAPAAVQPGDAAAALPPAPLPKVRPAPPAAEPVRVASADPETVPDVPSAPVAEPAPAAAAAAEAQPAAFGAYVQLSSQRSEAAARQAFAALQSRYPGILGNAAADIQRADLGDKGVYFRARVGKASREEAVALCEQLRAAGGDCLIARN